MGPTVTLSRSRAWSRLEGLPGLRRAWPERDGAVSYELLEPGSGLLRAGRIDTDGRLRELPYAQDPALPSLHPPRAGRLVVHRPGRRAVVIEQSSVSKLLRSGRAPGLAACAASSRFHRAGLRTASVLGCTPDRIDLELLPGRPLGELGDAGLPGWRRLVRAWPGLARRSAGLLTHSTAKEIAVLRGWTERARATGALEAIDRHHGRGRLERAVDRACTALAAGSAPAVLTHRDLHDGQLLWDGRTLSLLDLDTAALAEAALDLANLTAHVDLMRADGRLGPQAHDQVTGLLDDLARRLPTTAQRLRAHTSACRLRLALVHAFRPRTEGWLPRWTARALEDLEAADSPRTTTEWRSL